MENWESHCINPFHLLATDELRWLILVAARHVCVQVSLSLTKDWRWTPRLDRGSREYNCHRLEQREFLIKLAIKRTKSQRALHFNYSYCLFHAFFGFLVSIAYYTTKVSSFPGLSSPLKNEWLRQRKYDCLWYTIFWPPYRKGWDKFYSGHLDRFLRPNGV